ncbi:DNA cytosine methyltransferase [Deinococcus kurensis]|uniref:DNA cytosine methyltransferase n=1 Tax=Deinococcus kurensis TaxID=2662757 RepID=UPI001391D3AF|nr:DNA cytosine methyltransferase [Deinococcus kurensis]
MKAAARQSAPAYAPLFPELPLRDNAVVAPGELAVVNFAGAGGASIGIGRALRRPVNIAINHNPVALNVHRLNEPHTIHYIEDVWHVDPREAVAGRPVALAQFSPDCTHFSRSRGGKPKSKKIRGLAWVAVRWAATVRPRVIIIENVSEFRTWGPLGKDGRPDPAQEGRTYRSFINALRRLGYEVEDRDLRACDYGAGTTRTRFFLIARCDGAPITWPEPTHAAPDDARVLAGQLKPWPVAADFIDWSKPTRTIFGRKTDIAEDSQKRIAIGFERWTLRAERPFLVPDANASAFIEKAYGGNYSGPGIPVTAPLDTITTVDHHRLVTAHIGVYYGNDGKGDHGQPCTEPLRTIPTKDRFALSTACIYRNFGTSHSASIEQPAGTIVTTGCGKLGVTTCELDTVPEGGMLSRARQVYALLMRFLGAERLGGNADHDRQLVHLVLGGERFTVWDLRFRMFEPSELYGCQGFPPEFIYDRTAEGKRLPKSVQNFHCGNSVSPYPMEAITAAQFIPQYQEAAD